LKEYVFKPEEVEGRKGGFNPKKEDQKDTRSREIWEDRSKDTNSEPTFKGVSGKRNTKKKNSNL